MKVTLNSIVLAKYEIDVDAFVNTQAEVLAKYLVDKSDNVEDISRVLADAVALIPAVLEHEAKTIVSHKMQTKYNF